MGAEKDGKPKFFASAAAFRKWLELNHAKKQVLSVGFHNAKSDKAGLSYKEAVDEALCFGWIDGVRRSFDETRYTCRFTPRKQGSYWSAVNTRRFHELERLGQVAPPGAQVFARRDAAKTGKYSFEHEEAAFSQEQLEQFEANRPAWAFLQRAGCLVPANGDLPGPPGQEAGDPGPPPRTPDRLLGPRRTNRAARLEEIDVDTGSAVCRYTRTGAAVGRQPAVGA